MIFLPYIVLLAAQGAQGMITKSINKSERQSSAPIPIPGMRSPNGVTRRVLKELNYNTQPNRESLFDNPTFAADHWHPFPGNNPDSFQGSSPRKGSLASNNGRLGTKTRSTKFVKFQMQDQNEDQYEDYEIKKNRPMMRRTERYNFSQEEETRIKTFGKIPSNEDSDSDDDDSIERRHVTRFNKQMVDNDYILCEDLVHVEYDEDEDSMFSISPSYNQR
ncbi:hypothetical protein NEOLI_004369 [Neolecta irregularis DAH-3]|uniref:Uncharacterized protein n=1 Tax=Neolecta irregularis (strain DAH-3) TaxID=1198029 RepID=A0A1U7LJ89_NEOID|nr:hypothetical protein NEOLI_004369 [Neolecta irregularis DAH-3]|eukprot:OLL22591.1 hypothetical protein NEOLI_004369 [Neolecta irregularis DAH-3]